MPTVLSGVLDAGKEAKGPLQTLVSTSSEECPTVLQFENSVTVKSGRV